MPVWLDNINKYSVRIEWYILINCRYGTGKDNSNDSAFNEDPE